MEWEIRDSVYEFECPWFKIRKDKVKLPTGLEVPDFYIQETSDWVNVIAITTEGEFIIEEQYRHGLGKVVYEICAGVVEKGESPLDAAKRELKEETGYGNGVWSQIGVYSPDSNRQTNLSYSFLAKGVSVVGNPHQEETENIKVHLLSESEVKDLLVSGRIVEGVMAAPLWRFLATK